MIENHDFNAFGFANGKHPFRAKAQQPIFVGHDQASDVTFQHRIEQTF